MVRPLLLVVVVLLRSAEALPAPAGSARASVWSPAVDGRCGFKPGESKERCECVAKTDAAESDLGDALSWLCGQPALDGCKDINPGGSSYEPNTLKAHADWAFEHYYLTDESYTSCFFASNAYLIDSQDHRPPLGHYELTKDGRLMYPTPAKTTGATDTIAPGASKVWNVVDDLTGNWVGTNVIFRLWLSGSVPGCRGHAEVAYDFDGDGTADRTEVYNDSSDSLRVLPEYEAYTNAVGTDDSTNGDYAPMKSGKVSLTVFNDQDSAGAIQVMVATQEAPSFITVPYHDGPEVRPPPPPKPTPSHDCPTWYETFQRPASSTTWVNVKAPPYNAKGDGSGNDFGAINHALTASRQPWKDGASQPRIAYFPSGHYRISDTLPSYMYTHMIGNHECRPTIILEPSSTAHFAIMAAPNFEGPGVDNFYHQIQNIDVQVSNPDAMGLHWKVAQGTNLRNMTFLMCDGTRCGDTAILIENGGGGFIGDVSIKGGKTGLDIGGQQWMIRNLSIEGCTVMGINLRWNWLFTFMGTHLSNMPEGFGGGDDDNPSVHGGVGDSLVGSLVLIDTTFEKVKTGIVEKYPELTAVVMDRVTADADTEYIIKGPHSKIEGGQSIRLYRQGYGYEEGEELFPFLRDIPNIDDKHGPSTTSMAPIRPDARMEARGLPMWQTIPESAVVNALSRGCAGDGKADDTKCLQTALADATTAVFLPSGTYLVSETVHVPAGKMLVGEGWSEIQAKAGAPAFSNAAAPAPMLSLDKASSSTPTTMSNLMLTVGGDLPGLIVLEWLASDVSFFDVHWRLEHNAYASLVARSTAGGYLENCWVWTADHDINGGAPAGMNVDVPHGLMSESTQPTWFVGVAVEHNSLANFNFTNAAKQTLLMAQTETPYWQDPPTAKMINIENSQDIAIYGAVGENWYHGSQVHMNNIEACRSCTGARQQIRLLPLHCTLER